MPLYIKHVPPLSPVRTRLFPLRARRRNLEAYVFVRSGVKRGFRSAFGYQPDDDIWVDELYCATSVSLKRTRVVIPDTFVIRFRDDPWQALRAERLHKWHSHLQSVSWNKLILLTHDELVLQGVTVQGALKRLLRLFHAARKFCGVEDEDDAMDIDEPEVVEGKAIT